MKRVFSYVFLLYVVCYCNKPDRDELQITADPPPTNPSEFIIRKGSHYAEQSVLQTINSSSISASVMFDSSAIYTTVSAANQADINKLVGFSDCNTNHQDNSARLGWSWDGKDVIIYAYAYVNKVRISKTLGAVQLNKRFDCFVKAEGGYYYFKSDKIIDSIPRHCSTY